MWMNEYEYAGWGGVLAATWNWMIIGALSRERGEKFLPFFVGFQVIELLICNLTISEVKVEFPFTVNVNG